MHTLTVFYEVSGEVNLNFVLSNDQVLARQHQLFTLKEVWINIILNFLFVNNNFLDGGSFEIKEAIFVHLRQREGCSARAIEYFLTLVESQSQFVVGDCNDSDSSNSLFFCQV